MRRVIHEHVLLRDAGVARGKRRPHRAPSRCRGSGEVTAGPCTRRCGSCPSWLCAVSRTRAGYKWILTGFSKEAFTMQRMLTLARTRPLQQRQIPRGCRSPGKDPGSETAASHPNAMCKCETPPGPRSPPARAAHAQGDITRGERCAGALQTR